MKTAYHPIYVHPVPENHRFPMMKYELLKSQLIRLNIVQEDCFFEPNLLNESLIITAHSKNYWQRLKGLQLNKKEERASGFIHNDVLIKRELIITQGTVSIARHCLDNIIGFNIAGGTHHAFSDKPEGFCLLNDFAIAIHTLFKEKKIRKALIIDLDVHQGNGTAEIFKDDPRVFTFSVHGADNYPFRKEKSDWDIGLQTGVGDEEYLSILAQALDSLETKGRFDIICFQAGVDVLASDKMGHLSLSINGCKRRDELVFKFAKRTGTPICVTMGGGYSTDIKIILEAHTNTFKAAAHVFNL